MNSSQETEGGEADDLMGGSKKTKMMKSFFLKANNSAITSSN